MIHDRRTAAQIRMNSTFTRSRRGKRSTRARPQRGVHLSRLHTDLSPWIDRLQARRQRPERQQQPDTALTLMHHASPSPVGRLLSMDANFVREQLLPQIFLCCAVAAGGRIVNGCQRRGLCIHGDVCCVLPERDETRMREKHWTADEGPRGVTLVC